MSHTETAEAGQVTTISVDELEDGAYGNFPLNLIRISRTNRKTFKEQALQELAASITEKGVIQPILIRPVTPTDDEPQIFEIVAGERRFRSSIIAGITTIPAIYRILSDLQAAEIQILENLQREDPHPLEEAEGYEQLMLKHGYNADQLADKIKKSRSYIYGRLKLCALTTDVRAKFLSNEIPASTALLIARIPVPALQIRALAEILKPSQYQTDPLSYRAAVEHVQNRYTLDLAKATFPITDAKLLTAAGDCSKCPKRTGNQPEIFPGISADVCTDPDCFSEKLAAHATRTVTIANRQGIPVYEGEDAHRMRSDTFSSAGALAAWHTPLYTFSRVNPATGMSGIVRALLPDDQLPAAVGYIKEKNGLVTALYDRAAVQIALEKSGACETVDEHAKRTAGQPKDSVKESHEAKRKAREDEQAALQEEAKTQTAFRVALYTQMRRRGSDGPSLELLRAATKYALVSNLSLPDDLLKDLYPFDAADDRAINAYIDTASMPDVLQILIDMVFCDMLSVQDWDLRNNRDDADAELAALTDLAKCAGIDLDQVRQSLLPEAPPELPSDAALDYATELDLANFIAANPERIDELHKAILGHPRGDVLLGLIERAAVNLGYGYKSGRWSMPGDIETDPDDGAALSEQLDEASSAPQPKRKSSNKKSK